MMGGGPNFQPLPGGANFQPLPGRANFQPLPGGANFQPQGRGSIIQPQGRGSMFQPQGGAASFQPPQIAQPTDQRFAPPTDHRRSRLEQVLKAMTGSRFYNLDRLRRDAIGLMDKHVSLMPSNGEQKDKPGVPCLKLEGNVQMMYQGKGYGIPLAIFLETDYPAFYPTVKVCPTDDLVIHPNHDKVDVHGTVYLDYVHQWDETRHVLGAVTELCRCFEARPFIFKRPPQPAPQPANTHAASPPANPPAHVSPPPPAQGASGRPAASPPPHQPPPSSYPLDASDQLSQLSIADPPEPPAPSSSSGTPPPPPAHAPSSAASGAGQTVTKLVESFSCPISMDLMSDPVVAADGHSYERVFIEEWLETKSTSPLTNQVLAHKQLVPNHNLRSQILEYQNSTASRSQAR